MTESNNLFFFSSQCQSNFSDRSNEIIRRIHFHPYQRLFGYRKTDLRLILYVMLLAVDTYKLNHKKNSRTHWKHNSIRLWCVWTNQKKCTCMCFCIFFSFVAWRRVLSVSLLKFGVSKYCQTRNEAKKIAFVLSHRARMYTAIYILNQSKTSLFFVHTEYEKKNDEYRKRIHEKEENSKHG